MRNHVMYGAVEVFSIKAGAASVLLGSVLAELYNPLSVCISIQESGRCWRESLNNDVPPRWVKRRKDVLSHNIPWLRTCLLLLFLTSGYTRWSHLRPQGPEWQRITEFKTRRGKGLWVPRGGYSEKRGPICRGILAEESWTLAVSESPGGSCSHS